MIPLKTLLTLYIRDMKTTLEMSLITSVCSTSYIIRKKNIYRLSGSVRFKTILETVFAARTKAEIWQSCCYKHTCILMTSINSESALMSEETSKTSSFETK